MDILLVGGTPSVRGGVELFCERAEQALTQRGGHRVAVVHSDTAYARWRAPARIMRAARDLRQRRRESWDCIWLQYVNLPELVLLLICRALGYRVLVTPHLGSHWASQSNPSIRWIGTRLLSFAHGLALLSPTQAEELQLPLRVPRFEIRTFLPQSFPNRQSEADGEDDGLALVHAGRLSRGKGTFLFLDLCADLKSRGCAFSAQLIGSCDAATRTKIDRVIEANDLADCVTFVGPLSEASMMNALTRADVLVHLSTVDSFPLIVLEAIACGAFPICKDLAGARLMATIYCGHLVRGPDPVAQAAEFLSGAVRSRLQQAATRARAHVIADYDWRNCVSLVEAAIKALPR